MGSIPSPLHPSFLNHQSLLLLLMLALKTLLLYGIIGWDIRIFKLLISFLSLLIYPHLLFLVYANFVCMAKCTNYLFLVQVLLSCILCTLFIVMYWTLPLNPLSMIINTMFPLLMILPNILGYFISLSNLMSFMFLSISRLLLKTFSLLISKSFELMEEVSLLTKTLPPFFYLTI